VKDELLSLTRELRRRVERSHESDFSTGGNSAAFEALKAKVNACRLCPLGSSRLNAVFGVGSPNAEVMFIGEGPGFEEDHRGEPFVGRSGQLLDKILESIGLSRRTNAYIANIVKCHPMKDPSDPESRANDRPPTPEESESCKPYLDEQIKLIRPKFLEIEKDSGRASGSGSPGG
jgi:DNA polymerase